MSTDRIDCRNCGGDGFTLDVPTCPACQGTGREPVLTTTPRSGSVTPMSNTQTTTTTTPRAVRQARRDVGAIRIALNGLSRLAPGDLTTDELERLHVNLLSQLARVERLEAHFAAAIDSRKEGTR